MKETITALIKKFGNQRKAAVALGVTDRTFRNYVKEPDCVPVPMRRLMKSILEQPSPIAPPLRRMAKLQSCQPKSALNFRPCNPAKI